MGCPWSQRPMKNPASHSVSKSSHSVSKSTDSYKIFALSQFRYWPSMEQKANGKSILALSFEIFAPKKFFCWKYPNYQIQDLKKFFTKKIFYGTQSNFDIGRIWSRRPMENRSSHSVSKSSHLVIAKISKKKFFVGNIRIIKF